MGWLAAIGSTIATGWNFLVDTLVKIFQITRIEAVAWLLAVAGLGLMAVSFWATGLPLEQFAEWMALAVGFAVALIMLNRFAKASPDPEIKWWLTLVSSIAGVVLFVVVLAFGGNLIAYRMYRTWYPVTPTGLVQPSSIFAGKTIPTKEVFAHKAFFTEKRDDNPQTDKFMKSWDKWQQWCWLGTCENPKRKQLVVVSSDPFGENYSTIKAQIQTNDDVRVSAAHAFLRKNLDLVPRYRPQYKQVETTMEGGQFYVNVINPQSDETLIVFVIVESNGDFDLPSNLPGFGIQLVPTSSSK